MDTKLFKKNLFRVIFLSMLVVLVILFVVVPRVTENRGKNNQPSVANFEQCVAAGNATLESYPRQCRHGDLVFTEDIGQVVGGDKDEHGCIGPAGYAWCQPKNKCLRSWEEACYASAAQEIQYFLAGKYNKPLGEVVVRITKQTESHAAGSVKFGPESSAGGMFLAVRSGTLWEVVYDGNGSVDCKKMKTQYNFSDEILKPNFCN